VLVDRMPTFGARLGGPSRGLGASNASVTRLAPERVTLAVNAPADSVVLIRQPYSPGWRATVDGHPAPLLRADGFLQGVAVGAGRHAIELRYVEPTGGLGLAVSLLSIVALLVAAAWTAIASGAKRSQVRDRHES
jgi:uncharacterized membrane protein YfhO